MEKAVLNVNVLNITQGMNSGFSHKNCLAIDIAGHNGFKAPFTGTIKKIYTKDANQVWLESNEKVKYADGTEDYMTLSIWHDNDVSNLYVGKVIKQGEIFYQQGTKGYVTGAHNHLTVGKGKFTGSGWYGNEQGQAWCINNQYDITKALFLHNDVKVQNNGGYNWVETKDYNVETKKQEELYLNLNPDISSWRVYKTNNYYIPSNSSDILLILNPKKFGGLSYKILEDKGNYHFKIKTNMKGFGYIAGNPNKYSCTITDKPIYKCGNY